VSEPAGTDLFGAIHQLVLERALGQITADRFDELDRLLGASDEARVLYVQYVQETVGLQSMLGRDGHLPLPQFAGGDAARLASPPPRPVRSPGLFRRFLQIGSAAMWAAVALFAGLLTTAIVIVGMVVHGALTHRNGADVAKSPVGSGDAPAHDLQFPKPGPPVAHLAGTANCRWGRDGGALEVGAGIESGRTIVLESGLAEIVFRDGAQGLLEGPATLQVGSEKSVFLRIGRFTATVESPSARGFEVFAPGMRYTDLGTEFGVFVARDGVQEMHVFRGKVMADEFRESEGEGDLEGAKGPEQTMSSRDSSGPLPRPPKSSSRHVALTANQAIRVAAPNKPFERIAADESRFVRAMPPLEPFPLFSTGVGLDRGAADPHWEIVAVSMDSSFKARAAVVADPEPDYCADARDKAQWISLSKALPDLPGGCRMTFRTKFDLTGFDPATARIVGHCATDDWPVELQLNGRVSVPLPPEKRTLTLPVVPLEIEKGFVAGENVLEIVVENADVPKMPLNHMALFVHWKGTARKAAK
jgi:hypothetical protein